MGGIICYFLKPTQELGQKIVTTLRFDIIVAFIMHNCEETVELSAAKFVAISRWINKALLNHLRPIYFCIKKFPYFCIFQIYYYSTKKCKKCLIWRIWQKKIGVRGRFVVVPPPFLYSSLLYTIRASHMSNISTPSTPPFLLFTIFNRNISGSFIEKFFITDIICLDQLALIHVLSYIYEIQIRK